MSSLVIVRHGQSQFNLENRFTGWVDSPLSDHGRSEALDAGRKLSTERSTFSHAFTSTLIRAIETLDIILSQIDPAKQIIVRKNAALNERNYGSLQGLNKTETEAKFTSEKVNEWRRSFRSTPPGGESLFQTYERVTHYYTSEIEPVLKGGSNVLIVAHGNSLRALMMKLENISEDSIEKVEIATAAPRVYLFNDKGEVTECRYI